MKVESPWSKGLLLVCQKCGKSFSPAISSDEIRGGLKAKFRDLGISSEVRVVSSSCLDVCNDGEQAIAYVPLSGPTEVYSLKPQSQVRPAIQNQAQNEIQPQNEIQTQIETLVLGKLGRL